LCDRVVLLRGDLVVNVRKPVTAGLARFDMLPAGRNITAVDADEDAHIEGLLV
jgi:hypothetical protein